MNFPQWRRGGVEINNFKWKFRSAEESSSLARAVQHPVTL